MPQTMKKTMPYGQTGLVQIEADVVVFREGEMSVTERDINKELDNMTEVVTDDNGDKVRKVKDVNLEGAEVTVQGIRKAAFDQAVAEKEKPVNEVRSESIDGVPDAGQLQHEIDDVKLPDKIRHMFVTGVRKIYINKNVSGGTPEWELLPDDIDIYELLQERDNLQAELEDVQRKLVETKGMLQASRTAAQPPLTPQPNSDTTGDMSLE
ncbi:MAG: hypothetical protein F4118_00530 [Acidimicrobiaceae bacterium]|nr:hypothetical protein [Candidatus Poribacteria bacterium]MYI34907.1 hypothetical protein [Acidimicrobiaceae bacterium]